MTTRKWFALGVTLFTVIFVWYLIDHKIITLRMEEAAENRNAQQAQANDAASAKTLEEKIDAESDSQGVNETQAKESSNSSLVIDQELNNWIKNESKTIDLKDKNPKMTEKKMRLFAGQLRQNQLDQLLTTSLNANSAANEKILSTYLITLNATDGASENMKKLASEKLTVQGDVQPHTVDEVRRSQELALKYMAIDELSLRARKNVPDYNRLVAIANSAPEREVRDYAEQKRKEIGP